MKEKGFTINTDKSTAKVKQAIDDTIRHAEEIHLNRITVEIFLYNILGQPELSTKDETFAEKVKLVRSQLLDHIEVQRIASENEPSAHIIANDLAVLFDMTHLCESTFKDTLERAMQMVAEIDMGDNNQNKELVKMQPAFKVKYKQPTSIPYIIGTIYNLPNTHACSILFNSFDPDPNKLYSELLQLYQDDINDYKRKEGTTDEEEEISTSDMPLFEIDGFINGKRMTPVNKEMVNRILSSTERLLEKIKEFNQGSKSGIHIIGGNNLRNIFPGNLPIESSSDDPSYNDPSDDDPSNDRKTTNKPQWATYLTCLNRSDNMAAKHFVGREKELDRAIRILSRKEKSNVIFIGEPGVGKTALIYGITNLIDKSTDFHLTGRKVYGLDIASLIAGTSYHGELEKRVKTLLEGVSKHDSILLYIDDIHAIMETNGGNTNVSIASIMKPYMDAGKLHIIGSTTYKDYNRSIANSKSISRHFQLIDIKEPSIEESIEIVSARVKSLERYHHVRYTDEAIRYAVEQSARLINDRRLPDKAIDIIDEAGAYLEVHPLLNKKGQRKADRYQTIGKDIIRHILTDVCRIDAKALSEDSNANLRSLADNISQNIYGQDQAVRQVARAVMMSKAGLTDPDKPIASFLFVGPTGVGKTELCKVLAKELGIELVRLDMSEYTEKHTVSKLIGSPAGYIGYEEGGLLTDMVRRTPNCVLLLDEIEKAHADIYNILLQVMDYANLTDNKGNKTDFRNVILIMTSNAGAQYASQASIGFGGGQSKGEAMMSTVKKTFKPEFLNRLSSTVIFNDMDSHMASLILDKKLRDLSSRLAKKDVTLTLSPEAHDYLLTQGFSARYGAREMDRAIQQHLTPILMDEILFGSLAKGGSAHFTMTDKELKIDRLHNDRQGSED